MGKCGRSEMEEEGGFSMIYRDPGWGLRDGSHGHGFLVEKLHDKRDIPKDRVPILDIPFPAGSHAAEPGSFLH
jgi:hypothetical protein